VKIAIQTLDFLVTSILSFFENKIKALAVKDIQIKVNIQVAL
jgi:hypothetical protein